eukprot:CAMPEP_0197852308 /NCGR_PEP_ID=MMETSP1438-20131217/20223_1 /TAXON_ID=1461541 /ORGANISM="Pterosperma sp., Strain CCMP1384" /LENGTH=285 /DNA_ID=CAMNT_0043466291 /DNA_START=616 /DNA_END=1473 /DNA_ORIENTATION=-
MSAKQPHKTPDSAKKSFFEAPRPQTGMRNSIVSYDKKSSRYEAEDLKVDWDFDLELDPTLEAKVLHPKVRGETGEPEHCYVWGATVSDFWRNYGCKRDEDIRTLVSLGDTHAHLRDIATLSKGVQRLGTLLPDAWIAIMVERHPDVLCVDFVHASHLVIQLQAFLEEEGIKKTTEIFEKHPRLLFAESIQEEADVAAAHLYSIAPHVKRPAMQVVKDYPELLYRIHNYDTFALLPLDIQNMLLSPEDEFGDREEEWSEQWDQWGDADDGAWFDGHHGEEEDEDED